MPDTLDRLKAALADRYTIEIELGRGGTATVRGLRSPDRANPAEYMEYLWIEDENQ